MIQAENRSIPDLLANNKVVTNGLHDVTQDDDIESALVKDAVVSNEYSGTTPPQSHPANKEEAREIGSEYPNQGLTPILPQAGNSDPSHGTTEASDKRKDVVSKLEVGTKPNPKKRGRPRKEVGERVEDIKAPKKTKIEKWLHQTEVMLLNSINQFSKICDQQHEKFTAQSEMCLIRMENATEAIEKLARERNEKEGQEQDKVVCLMDEMKQVRAEIAGLSTSMATFTNKGLGAGLIQPKGA